MGVSTNVTAVSHAGVDERSRSTAARVYASGPMPRSTAFRWISLGAAFAALVGGMALFYLSEDRTPRNVGVALFVLGAVGYVAARIAMFQKERR